MAPPQIFINTKTLELEKQPETAKEDGGEDSEPVNKQEQEAKKEDNDNSDPAKDTVGSDHEIGMEPPLPILSYIVVFTGLAIAVLGAFLWNEQAIGVIGCYFFVLGLHLFSLGCLHFVQAPQTKLGKLLSSFLARCEEKFKPHIARMLVGTIVSVGNIIFTVVEMHILLNKWNTYGYDTSDLQRAGVIFSICLSLPWPLLHLLLTNSSNNTHPSQETKLTDLLQRKQEQVTSKIVSLLPSLQDPVSSSNFKINVPTSADPLPSCYIQQTIVVTIMLLVSTMFTAQLIDVGLTTTDTTTDILRRLEDPWGTYNAYDPWLLLGYQVPAWLGPAETKLAVIVAAPVTLLLCLPLFFLNRRLSFASLVITSLLMIPLGFLYLLLAVYTTNWLIILVPSSLSLTSLALRIVIAILPSIIAALLFALKLSYLENFATKTKLQTNIRYCSTILALLTFLVTSGGFTMISTNLMLNHTFSHAVEFHTFATAHLSLSTILMVIALLVVLVGHNISGLTSLLLGSGAFGLTVATVVFFNLCLKVRKFMKPLEFGNAEVIFIINAAVGLLVGSVFMLKGGKAFVRLLACLLNAFIILTLFFGLGILAIARIVISLGTLGFTKDQKRETDMKTNKSNEQV